MHTFKQNPVEIKQQSRFRLWLLATIMAVAFVLVWAIGARSAPAVSSSASGDPATAPRVFLNSPNPFVSPVFLPFIER
jgi:hypothetical protein